MKKLLNAVAMESCMFHYDKKFAHMLVIYDMFWYFAMILTIENSKSKKVS